MVLEREDILLLHQYDDLLKDIHNREKLVWTIGGLFISFSFVLMAYSIINIENTSVILVGGTISIVFMWSFFFHNLDYSFINKKKMKIREIIELKLDFKFRYEHKPSKTGKILFLSFILFHACWSIIWLFYHNYIKNVELFYLSIPYTFYLGGISLIILIILGIEISRFNDRKIKELNTVCKNLVDKWIYNENIKE